MYLGVGCDVGGGLVGAILLGVSRFCERVLVFGDTCEILTV